MKPKSVVTCLPSKNLDNAINFYQKCFKVKTSDIEDGIITIELGNLSLFIMDQPVYEQYTKKIGLSAGYSVNGLQCLHSCAVEDNEIISHIFARAEEYGGSVLQKMKVNEWDQATGYVSDPDGHVWEIVHLTNKL